MVKILTQSIPAELLDAYQRAAQPLTTHKQTNYVRSRYPWRVPHMQNGGWGVSAGQRVQRDRFIYVKNKYALLSKADKARWAAANPEYHSYLFGYNFFMLEGLMGGGPTKYPQMIKSIQVVKEEVPTTGTKSYTINAVDPAKCVVMLQGNSYISDKVQRGESSVAAGGTQNIALSPNVDPAISEVIVNGVGSWMEIAEGTGEGKGGNAYVSALTAAQLTVKGSAIGGAATFWFSWQIIEHKAQTVYPVLVSIAATAVVIDWALVPTVAADVTITVVEYL